MLRKREIDMDSRSIDCARQLIQYEAALSIPFQLIIKDSLFEDNKVWLAEVQKIVAHLSHSSTACEKIKAIEVDSMQTKQTAP